MFMDIMPQIDIVAKVLETKKLAQRVYPVRSNRASQLGHPCERCLVYWRTCWEKAQLPPIEREFIFDGGKLIEKLALQEIADAGFTVTNQGRDFEDKNTEITGHIDAILVYDGKKYPCEIKGISPFHFDKINTAEDMLKAKDSWIKAYPAQLQLYLYLSNQEMGLFYIKNKLTFVPKQIWVTLDYDYCESLLQKAERINKHIKDNTLPERINDIEICMKCEFKHICLPDLKRAEGMQIIENEELEMLLNRLEELKEAYKEYQQIEEKIKTMVEGKENIICGNWLITGKYIIKKIPPQEAKEVKYWQKKIIKLE